MEEVEEYITHRHNMVAHYIATRTIMDLCEEAVRRLTVLLLLFLKRCLCHEGVRIVGLWCFTPCIEAKETLDF